MSQESYIVRCKNCGVKNRVPAKRIKDRPVCGKCKAPLPEMTYHSAPVMVTDSTFENEVMSYPGTVLVDCWAPWCGPCKMMGPILDQVAREYAGRAKIAKINLDQNPMISSRYNILSIPTLLFFKNGQLVNNVPGAVQKPEIDRMMGALV